MRLVESAGLALSCSVLRAMLVRAWVGTDLGCQVKFRRPKHSSIEHRFRSTQHDHGVCVHVSRAVCTQAIWKLVKLAMAVVGLSFAFLVGQQALRRMQVSSVQQGCG